MPRRARALAMMGPLPPSLVRWLTNSTFVLRPAAPASRPASAVMVRRRWKLSALSRLSTTWTISSTKPSRPTNARSRLARSTPARRRAAVCSRNSSGCSMAAIKKQIPKMQNDKNRLARKQGAPCRRWWLAPSGGRQLADQISEAGPWGPPHRRRSFGRDADDLQDALQVVVAEKADVEGAFALAVAQLHLGAEPFAQLRFESGHVHVAHHGRRLPGAAGGRAVFLMLLEARDQFLGLAHVE